MRIPKLEVERTEDGWLSLWRAGVKTRDIAREAGYKLRRVQAGIEAARLREGSRPTTGTAPRDPRLVPLFPLTPLTPQSQCPHHGPIKRGSVFCCMVCSRSGLDHLPALRLTPRDMIEAQKKPAAKPEPKRTRRERRHFALTEYLTPSNN